ncbi:MAG: hypothetical protein GY870_14135 [archaeon]|nr:hypothetical protein [archaeon]
MINLKFWKGKESIHPSTPLKNFSKKTRDQYLRTQSTFDQMGMKTTQLDSIHLKTIAEIIRDNPSQQDIFKMLAKVSEECGELSEALLKYKNHGGSEYKGVATAMDVIEEGTDVILAVLGVLMNLKHENMHHTIREMVDHKLQKWYDTVK